MSSKTLYLLDPAPAQRHVFKCLVDHAVVAKPGLDRHKVGRGLGARVLTSPVVFKPWAQPTRGRLGPGPRWPRASGERVWKLQSSPATIAAAPFGLVPMEPGFGNYTAPAQRNCLQTRDPPGFSCQTWARPTQGRSGPWGACVDVANSFQTLAMRRLIARRKDRNLLFAQSTRTRNCSND
jgi:hypothetical protein